MATQVLIAHTGQRLQIDAARLTSFDDLKASIARQTSIPAHFIITLTSDGKPVKIQSIQTEKEIFVYDNRLSQGVTSGAAPSPARFEIPIPKDYKVTGAPDFIEDTRSMQAWQELYKTRRAWALKVVNDCSQMAAATAERYDEMDVMLRCLDAAVSNLESVIRGLEPKYAELVEWAPTAQTEYGALTTGWEEYLSLARSIPVSSTMVRFIAGRDIGSSKQRLQRQTTLEDLVDLDTAQRAGRLAPAALRKFNNRIVDLNKVATRLFRDAEDLFREFERTMERSAMSHAGDAERLLQDIQAVARKIDTDYQTTLEYSSSSRDALSQASKVASTHTERLLPTIEKRALEMSKMLQYATQSRNSLAAESAEFMRSITGITSLSSSVKTQIASVNHEDELATFDYLRMIQQGPYLYASFVVESIKRREWLEKVKQDSSTLANEMALFQEEEVKRRRKWHKSILNAYGPQTPTPESRVPGLELNLLSEEDHWPIMTRKDLEEFYGQLQAQKADASVVDDVGKMIAELDNPTRQQSRRMKVFKNGSVHEAALGRSGLLIRGDDDLLRSLQDDKYRLENKLRTAESRVRRLEDLLHRQTQASRPSLGTLLQSPSQQLLDRNGSTISVRSPRISDDRRKYVEGHEALTQRIQQLEAELSAEKERSTVFEKDLSSRTTQYDDIKAQMDEANSTKKDLLENMEALKREFLEERKSLEHEIKRLQTRIDDTEEEIENFGESRENEKTSYDEKICILEHEIEQLNKEKDQEARKSEGQINRLRNEVCAQQDRLDAQERELQLSQEEVKSLREKLLTSSEAVEAQLELLPNLWEQLSPGECVPEEPLKISKDLSDRVVYVLEQLQSLDKRASVLRSEFNSAHNSMEFILAEKTILDVKLAEEEAKSTRLLNALTEAEARVGVLEGDLITSSEQLNQLQQRLVDGESGYESLRKQLEEEEAKTLNAREELASQRLQVDNLQENARLSREKLHESQSRLAELLTWFESRTKRTKDVTQRLYSQNERLIHLLERLSYSVTRRGDSMTINKVPRAERSGQSSNDSDPLSSLRRSSTFNLRSDVDDADMEFLYWMDSPDVHTETTRYEVFMTSLGSFNVDIFNETIYKRIKEVEHLARKLQREARGYREKAHLAQKDAHDKIAYKRFKEGDLALFLPTRNQASGTWAAFNVGCPHYFLREQKEHRLEHREWIVARISRIQERVVDLSKSLRLQAGGTGKDAPGAPGSTEDDNDNPFGLSDGLRWYLIDATEDKSGAPSTPGLSKSTVAANNVEAMADMHTHKRSGSKGGSGFVSRTGVASGIEGVSKTLSKSLESRRSSTGSRKALPFAIGAAKGRDSAAASETNSLRAAAADTPASTSPILPHATLQTSSRGAGTAESGDPSSDATVTQSAQLHSEVRNDIDSLVGP
ncbi:autophagy-related protein 11 [Podospora australis]|uniref:Autophagy-related protein 11 n=1 Tax=Podospora australis TaxID=1536484 RepID=A0AAN6WL23_9PEZI|nr:autophagy-related protein 11 [Podospora australis]